MRKPNNKGGDKKSPNKKFSSKKKFTSKRDKDEDSVEYNTRKNDLSWYVTDDQILKDVARIPYSIPVGYPMQRKGLLTNGLQASEWDNAIPGIAAMSLVPTIGNAQHANDAVNVAANGMYTFVRHLNSGSRNYDANDLIIYCMAVDCVYYVLSWCTRLYATLTLYAQGNRYLPDALLRAQYVDPENLRNNMAQFRAGINQRIRKISTLVVPSVLPIFSRHSWLFSNYFIEGESIKDQIYLFFPEAWYQFGYDSDQAGCLTAYKMYGSRTIGGNGGHLGVDDLFKILDDMIDPIFADEDFNIISGDILKAYGESNILKLGLIPDELPIGLAYNEEVLLQFKNAKVQFVKQVTNSDEDVVKQRKFFDDMFSIYQSAGKTYISVNRSPAAIGIVYDFDGTVNYQATHTTSDIDLKCCQALFNEWSKQTMLTSPHASVEPGENMINTRLTLAFDIEYDDTDESPTHARINEMYFGSEWPRELRYWTYHRNVNSGEVSLFSRGLDRCKVLTQHSNVSINNAITSYLPVRSAFKFAPEVSVILNLTDPDDPDNIIVEENGRTTFEVDNYTLVSADVIGLLHNAAIQGEYNIPRIALFPTK